MASTPLSPATTAHGEIRTVEQAIDNLPRSGLTRPAAVALALVFFFGIYEQSIMAIALPSMATGLKTDVSGLAFPVAVALLGFAVGAILMGSLADRFGRQFGLRFAFIALGLGAILQIFAWDVPSLTVFRFIVGCGMGAAPPIVTTYIGELSGRNRRGRQVAIYNILAIVLVVVTSFAALPLIGAVPGQAWRFLLGFPVLALLALPLVNHKHLPESPRWLVEHGRFDTAATIVRTLDRRARKGRGILDSVVFTEPARGVVARPFATLRAHPTLVRRLILLAIAWFLFFLAFGSVTTYLAEFLVRTGLSESTALAITAGSRVGLAVGTLAVVFLIERIERRTILIISMVVLALGVALIMIGLGQMSATIGTLLLGIGSGAMAPTIYTYTAEVFPTEVRATSSSIADGFGNFGAVFGPFTFLPLLLTAGPVVTGVGTVVILAIAVIFVVAGAPRTRGKSLEEVTA